jgi:transcriptional regulator with XRE-family HTH domain
MSSLPENRAEVSAERVADAVRAEAARARLTQSDLAEILGIDRRAVGRRLKGRPEFTPTELSRLAAHLEIPVSVLMGGGVPA